MLVGCISQGLGIVISPRYFIFTYIPYLVSGFAASEQQVLRDV